MKNHSIYEESQCNILSSAHDTYKNTQNEINENLNSN